VAYHQNGIGGKEPRAIEGEVEGVDSGDRGLRRIHPKQMHTDLRRMKRGANPDEVKLATGGDALYRTLQRLCIVLDAVGKCLWLCQNGVVHVVRMSSARWLSHVSAAPFSAGRYRSLQVATGDLRWAPNYHCSRI